MLGRSRGKRGSRRRGNLTPWTGLLLLVLGWAACYFSYVSPVWGEGSRIQDSDGASQPSTIEEENEPSPATLSSVEPSQEEEDYPPPHDEGTMKAVSASAWRSPVAPNFHAARRARHFSGRDRTYTDLKHMKNGIERKEKLKHWTDLSLEELSGFYKGLKYKDVVIERWFDKDYERLVNRNRETWTNKAEGERIPRKLHFTWKTSNLGELPDLFEESRSSGGSSTPPGRSRSGRTRSARPLLGITTPSTTTSTPTLRSPPFGPTSFGTSSSIRSEGITLTWTWSHSNP